jgi:nucleotide-binding universal stress UspA family protein
MYQHIMLPLDGSELSMMAVPQAIALAKALRSRMTLITVVSPYHTGVTTPITSGIVHDVEKGRDEEARKEAQKLHDDITARAKSEGIRCESLVVIGDSPYAQIIENAGARKCDLIVMASHGRRGMDAILVASETVKVLTHSKIPVLVVR